LLTEDVDSDLLDTKLYRGAPAVLDTNSELTQYLQQERLPQDTNIYQYWKAKQYDYLVLAKIAKGHHAILAMSAPSESVFSVGGDVVAKKRNRLVGCTVYCMLKSMGYPYRRERRRGYLVVNSFIFTMS
jgi:hypothetical protein